MLIIVLCPVPLLSSLRQYASGDPWSSVFRVYCSSPLSFLFLSGVVCFSVLRRRTYLSGQKWMGRCMRAAMTLIRRCSSGQRLSSKHSNHTSRYQSSLHPTGLFFRIQHSFSLPLSASGERPLVVPASHRDDQPSPGPQPRGFALEVQQGQPRFLSL